MNRQTEPLYVHGDETGRAYTIADALKEKGFEAWVDDLGDCENLVGGRFSVFIEGTPQDQIRAEFFVEGWLACERRRQEITKILT